jgi:hypothetical protein
MNQEIANSGSWVSITSIVTGLKVVKRRALVLFPERARDFSLLQTMEPTEPTIQWMPVIRRPRPKAEDEKDLAPTERMRGI